MVVVSNGNNAVPRSYGIVRLGLSQFRPSAELFHHALAPAPKGCKDTCKYYINGSFVFYRISHPISSSYCAGPRQAFPRSSYHQPSRPSDQLRPTHHARQCNSHIPIFPVRSPPNSVVLSFMPTHQHRAHFPPRPLRHVCAPSYLPISLYHLYSFILFSAPYLLPISTISLCTHSLRHLPLPSSASRSLPASITSSITLSIVPVSTPRSLSPHYTSFSASRRISLL